MPPYLLSVGVAEGCQSICLLLSVECLAAWLELYAMQWLVAVTMERSVEFLFKWLVAVALEWLVVAAVALEW